jgi:hypothetical protein
MFLDTGPLTTESQRLIGHADEAEVAMVGQNILDGNGAVADCYWLLHGNGHYTESLPRSEGYWSIYLAYTQSLFFGLFGSNRFSVLLVATLFKSATALLASLVAWRLTSSRCVQISTLVLLLSSPQMVDVVDGFSDIQLTFLVFLTAYLVQAGIRSRSWSLWLLSGFIAGIAVGFKPSGLIACGLVVVSVAYLTAFGQLCFRPAYVFLGFASLGMLIGALPLLIHNYNADGTIFWPDMSRVAATARLYMYGGIDHNQAFYDPETNSISSGVLTANWVKVHLRFFILFLLEYFNGSRIHSLWLYPFVVYYLIRECVTDSKTQVLDEGLSLWCFLFFWIFLAGLALAFVVPLEPRYWNFLNPFEIIISCCVIWRLSSRFSVYVLVAALLIGIFNYSVVLKNNMDGSAFAVREKAYREAYERVDKIIPRDSIVLTSNPWQFSFHTRRKSISVPYNEDPNVLLSIAERFNANYLVIIKSDIRKAELMNLLQTDPPDFLEAILDSGGTKIFRIISRSEPSL